MKGIPPWADGVFDRFKGVKTSGNGWSVICPAHPDSHPSMSISIGTDGDKLIFNCHRGCAVDDIVKSAGLEMKDLWKPGSSRDRKKKEWIANYDYTDAEGNLIFQVTRWIEGDGRKTFTQRKPTKAGGWEYSTTGLKKPIYRYPQIKSAIEQGLPIYVAEGEKDVATLVTAGVQATCNPGGAGSWQANHTKALAKASQVFIVPDRDAVGMSHAAHIKGELEDLDVEVHVVGPPEGNKDVTWFFENAGGSLAGLVSIELSAENQDPFVDILTELRSLSKQNMAFEKKLHRARSMLDIAEFDPTDYGRLVKWEDFLKEGVDDYDWVIPGLLERQERVIVVAAEGVGKTMLARQVALMSSAGISPFRKDSMPKVATLFVDLENPERIIKRTSAKILERIRWVKPDVGPLDAHLLVKPDGLDLLKSEDRVLLERIVAQTEPDIIFLGPLYKAMVDPGGRTAEAVTTEVAKFFDYIRDQYNCAWWLEHHAPLGSSDSGRPLRPFGSSVWSRWSEFGIALAPDPMIHHRFEVKHYRGQRDEREWPAALVRGDIWPFEAEWVDSHGTI